MTTLIERTEAAATDQRKPCDFCRTAIVWTRNERTGKAMPLDYHPTDNGNVFITASAARHDTGQPVLVSSVLGKPAARHALQAAGWPLRLHHRMTCPSAERWSRPVRKT